MKNKEKKAKTPKPQEPEDDGHTVSDMNVPGMRWYVKDAEKGKKRDRSEMITRRELRAMILGAMRALLPYFLILIAVFSLVYWLIYLWLISVR